MRLEQPWDGYEDVRSVVLGDAEVVLNWTAREIGVRPLIEFVGATYLPASEGLRSVQPLIREISAWPSGVNVKDVAGILRELHECERVLVTASERNAKWRFELDCQGESGVDAVSPG